MKFQRISDQSNAFILQFGTITKYPPLVALGIPFTPQHSLRDDCSPFKVDDEGNMYCTGLTNGSIGDQNGTALPFAKADAYTAKFDSKGNILWITQFGMNMPAPYESSDEDNTFDLTIDEDKNVYVVGRTTSNLAGPGSYLGGGRDGFLAKLNSSGEIQWIRQFGTDQLDIAFLITVGRDGNLYCLGNTQGEFVANERQEARLDTDLFIAKFSIEGVFIDKIQIGESSEAALGLVNVRGNETPQSIVQDSDGNFVISVVTQGSLAGANPDTAPAKSDIVLWKVNSSLQTLWMRQYPYPGSDSISELKLNPRDNLIYAAGTTETSIGEENSLPGNNDAMVVKFSSSGDILKVSQLGKMTKVPGGDSTLDDFCAYITFDREGSIYCGGTTLGAIGEPNANPGTTDIFIGKWDRNLNFITAIQYGSRTQFPGGSNTQNDNLEGIHIDYFGNLYLGGETASSLGEPNGGGTLSDIFIFKMDMSTLDLSKPRF